MAASGDVARNRFLEDLEKAGTDCQAVHEIRRAFVSENHDGSTIFRFAEEFPLELGDRIINLKTEKLYEIVGRQPRWKSDVFWCFEASARAISLS